MTTSDFIVGFVIGSFFGIGGTLVFIWHMFSVILTSEMAMAKDARKRLYQMLKTEQEP